MTKLKVTYRNGGVLKSKEVEFYSGDVESVEIIHPPEVKLIPESFPYMMRMNDGSYIPHEEFFRILRALVRAGEKLVAIKFVRRFIPEGSDIGLKEAKEFIETYIENNG